MVGDHPQPNQPSNVDIANHMVTKIIHHDQVLWQLNSQTACPMKKYVEFLGKKPAGSRLNRPRKNTKVDFWLVVFRHPSEKYESVGLTIPNIWEKNMFQTTNQIWFRSFRLLGDETLTEPSETTLSQ